MEKLTGRLQASMEAEAELQRRVSGKEAEVPALQRQIEDLRHQAACDVEALVQARQQAHRLQDENADLLAEMHSARDDNALVQSQLATAREQARHAAIKCAELTAEWQELRSTVAVQAAKIDDSERQLVASAAEIEHLDQALSSAEEGKALLRSEARTAAEACEIAINERVAAEQQHEGRILQWEATISQLQDTATHRLRQLRELSEERDSLLADRTAAQQHMREQSTKLQHSQLSLLKEQRVAAAAEAAVVALRQELSGLQHQQRQVM